MPGVTRRSTAGGRAVLGMQAVEAIELVEGVDDDATDARGPSAWRSSSIALVVAVKDEPLGRDAGGQRDVQLAAGRDVEAHALLVDQPGHRRQRNALVA